MTQIMAKQFPCNWLVENYFEMESVCMLFSEPGTYKSFLAMDLAYCVANGMPWNGNQVTKGSVIFVAGEGQRGLQKRFKALDDKYQGSQANINALEKPLALMSSESVDDFLEEIKQNNIQPVLIVFDTLHRNFGFGDENSSRDFGVVLSNVDRIIVETKATVLLVHHCGHGDKTHSRGSSSIRASLDTEYQLINKGRGAVLKCRKMKEFEHPAELCFQLKAVEVTVTTGKTDAAYLELVDSSSVAAKPSRDHSVLNSLKEAVRTCGVPIPKHIIAKRPELAQKLWVDILEWKNRSDSDLAQDLPKQQSRQHTFNRSKTSLINSRVVEVINNFAFIL